MGWRVALDRETTTLQTVVNEAPTAAQYYSDAWVGYGGVVYYPGQYTGLPNKTQTYSVEADNAELRHYLARLARSSWCFSRSLDALRNAIKLFVYAWNRQRLVKRQYPRYHFSVAHFLYP